MADSIACMLQTRSSQVKIEMLNALLSLFWCLMYRIHAMFYCFIYLILCIFFVCTMCFSIGDKKKIDQSINVNTTLCYLKKMLLFTYKYHKSILESIIMYNYSIIQLPLYCKLIIWDEKQRGYTIYERKISLFLTISF